MNFGEYLLHLRRKNPAMRQAAKITLTVDSFEKQLKAAFEAGQRSNPAEPKNPFSDLFGMGK
jgi:hypothetical protein